MLCRCPLLRHPSNRTFKGARRANSHSLNSIFGYVGKAIVRNGSRLCENPKTRSATRTIFLSSMSRLNGLAMWAPKTVLNEQLVLSHLSTLAFSHNRGPSRRFWHVHRMSGTGTISDINIEPSPSLEKSLYRQEAAKELPSSLGSCEGPGWSAGSARRRGISSFKIFSKGTAASN